MKKAISIALVLDLLQAHLYAWSDQSTSPSPQQASTTVKNAPSPEKIMVHKGTSLYLHTAPDCIHKNCKSRG